MGSSLLLVKMASFWCWIRSFTYPGALAIHMHKAHLSEYPTFDAAQQEVKKIEVFLNPDHGISTDVLSNPKCQPSTFKQYCII